MADVVLSYARENQPQAALLAHALEQAGFNVWWDRAILPGTNFEPVVEAELSSARCVVVLWSAAALQSSWVRDEASLALGRNVLVPVSLDESEPPLGFRQQQIVSLAHWDGSLNDPAFTHLTQGIAKLAAGGADTAGLRTATFAGTPRPRSTRGLIAASACGALILIAAVMWAGGLLPARGAQVPRHDAAAPGENVAGADASAVVQLPAQATVTLPRAQVRVTILSGTVEPLSAGTRLLVLRVRFANDGTRSFYRTYYSSLRLSIDGTSHAPDDPPLAQVDASSAGEFDYRFTISAGATSGVLRVVDDDQVGQIELGFGGKR